MTEGHLPLTKLGPHAQVQLGRLTEAVPENTHTHTHTHTHITSHQITVFIHAEVDKPHDGLYNSRIADVSHGGSYHILSVGGGGMFTTSGPDSSCTSTASSSGVLDISSIFFLMNSFSVAFWKYLDLAILSTNLSSLLPVLPPPAATLW